MNATVQCLKSVPELRDALQKFEGSKVALKFEFLNIYRIFLILGISMSSNMLPAQSITAALRDLYSSMDQAKTIPPFLLLQVLHLAFPRFAEKNDHGYLQQVL